MSRTYKKLTLQYAYLQLEKEEVTDICKEIEVKIREYIKQHYPEHYDSFFAPQEFVNPESKKDQKEENTNDTKEIDDAVNAAESEDIEEYEIIKKPKNKDLKKLYRKIVERSHPDKIGNDTKANIFSDAVQAYDSNDIAKMLEIAGVLNIEILELSQESILLLNENIKTLSEEIFKKKQTTGWAWHKAGDDDEEKKRLVKFILNQKGIKL